MVPPIILRRRIWALAAQYAKEGRLLDLKKDIPFKLFFGGSSKESVYCRCKMSTKKRHPCRFLVSEFSFHVAEQKLVD